MLKLKSAIGISIIIVFVTGGFLSLLFKGNNRTSSILLTEQDLAQNSLQGAVGFSNKERSELIKVRDSLSRLLNQKQHELAKLQCEKVERENNGPEKTSASGGWCIHDTKELGEGGFHKTDLKLVPVLAQFFKGKRVASFGDGPGKYKKLLDETGLLAGYDAYDGAPYSESLSEGRVQFMDLSLPQYGLPLYDYIISLEVAEHIPKEYEHIYVDNIFRHAKEGIVISWAWPGQEGHSHVNGKTFENVKKLMEDNGFEHDIKSSDLLKKGSSLVWLQKSTNVFKRRSIKEFHDALKMDT